MADSLQAPNCRRAGGGPRGGCRAEVGMLGSVGDGKAQGAQTKGCDSVSKTPHRSRPRRLAVAAALVATGAETPPPTVDQALAAQVRPNVVVIETDDQTVESMRVMDNVNSLIGDQGATFRNSFVNYALCCPSRATFLTGQYMHNHGVLGNSPPDGGFERFQALHGNNNLAVWLRSAGYYTAMIGKYLNGYSNNPLVPPGWSEWQRGGSGHTARLRLHAERERHPGRLRAEPRRLQAGRADPKGGELRQPPGAEGEAVLPLAHLHGSPRRRPGPEPEPALQLRQHGEARPAPRPRVRLRAAAEAGELQRGRRLRQARRDPQPPALERRVRSRTSSAGTAAELESILSVDEGVRAVVRALRCKGRARQHRAHVHRRQRLLPRRAPDPDRQDAHLRGVDPGAAVDARARGSRRE